jgi:hypothetical protein
MTLWLFEVKKYVLFCEHYKKRRFYKIESYGLQSAYSVLLQLNKIEFAAFQEK